MSAQTWMAIYGAAGLLALSSIGCTRTAGDIVRPGDEGTSSAADDGELQFHFETRAPADEYPEEDVDDEDGSGDDVDSDPADVDPADGVATECGVAAGIRVDIESADGLSKSCDAEWAPVTVSGDYAEGAAGDHLVADCFFVVAAGVWNLESLNAIDSAGAELSCCTSKFPQSVDIEESETTEVSGLIQCETEQSGALDIFAVINVPPKITEVTISPSKFGATCSAISLAAVAEEPDGDNMTFMWQVLTAPQGADYTLLANGAYASFTAQEIGEYEIRLTVTDDLGASHWLDFPLHIVEAGSVDSCDTHDLCEDDLEG